MLNGKKAIIFGERDDIPGETIRRCIEAAGAEVVYQNTSCFVWTAAGAAGLAEQEEIRELAAGHEPGSLVVVLGLNEPDNLRVIATTVKEGDPGYAGALAGISLGIPSYHLLELKPEIPEDTWIENMAMKELEIPDEEREAIIAAMEEVRASG